MRRCCCIRYGFDCGCYCRERRNAKVCKFAATHNRRNGRSIIKCVIVPWFADGYTKVQARQGYFGRRPVQGKTTQYYSVPSIGNWGRLFCMAYY